MGYIYKISNDVNEKIYIGKTSRSISLRWGEHKKNAKTNKLDFPLYRAMRKYGIEHFSIEVIEKCNDEEIDDKEIYWIAYYQSYEKGYNCTKGGEGSLKDYKFITEIIQRYQAGERLDLICKDYHYDYTGVAKELRKRNIIIDTHAGPKKLSKKVAAIDPQTNIIVNIYPSISEASRQLCKEGKNPRAIANHISKYKDSLVISHGFLWKTKSTLPEIDSLYDKQEKFK